MSDQPATYKVIATCDRGHHSEFLVRGFGSLAEAEDFGRILDGTSPLYMYSPRDYPVEGSIIGKCQICGAWFTCTVEQAPDAGCNTYICTLIRSTRPEVDAQ